MFSPVGTWFRQHENLGSGPTTRWRGWPETVRGRRLIWSLPGGRDVPSSFPRKSIRLIEFLTPISLH